MFALPRDLFASHILNRVGSRMDMTSFSRACKRSYEVTSDTSTVFYWLLKHGTHRDLYTPRFMKLSKQERNLILTTVLARKFDVDSLISTLAVDVLPEYGCDLPERFANMAEDECLYEIMKQFIGDLKGFDRLYRFPWFVHYSLEERCSMLARENPEFPNEDSLYLQFRQMLLCSDVEMVMWILSHIKDHHGDEAHTRCRKVLMIVALGCASPSTLQTLYDNGLSIDMLNENDILKGKYVVTEKAMQFYHTKGVLKSTTA